ncbi:MAG: osmoprotectant transporter permease [Acidobacteriota bacterium]
MKFWILWGFDAAIALVALFFFAAGLADGRVSSFNILLWMVLLLGVAGVVGGALWLRSKARKGPAMAVLLILAIPGFLAVLFFLVVLIGHPRWN